MVFTPRSLLVIKGNDFTFTTTMKGVLLDSGKTFSFPNGRVRSASKPHYRIVQRVFLVSTSRRRFCSAVSLRGSGVCSVQTQKGTRFDATHSAGWSFFKCEWVQLLRPNSAVKLRIVIDREASSARKNRRAKDERQQLNRQLKKTIPYFRTRESRKRKG